MSEKPTTLQVISDRAFDPDTIISPSELIDVKSKDERGLSLRAHKLLFLLIDEAGPDAAEELQHTVELRELDYLRNLSVADTVETARELVQTVITYTRKVNGRDATTVEPLLYKVDRDHDAEIGAIRFRLSDALIEIMRTSNHWAALKRQVILAFRSRYALRLYEFIALRKGLKHKSSERLSIDEIKERFGVPSDQMNRWVHLKQRVLDKAIPEVNQLSGFKVTYEPFKKGRSVAGIILSWEVSDALGRAKAKQELDRHSAGRKARRNDTEETSALAFPATGSLEFAQDKRWRDISRRNGNGKDIELIAQDFRKWCEVKKIPLDASTIEKTFKAFCERSKP